MKPERESKNMKTYTQIWHLCLLIQEPKKKLSKKKSYNSKQMNEMFSFPQHKTYSSLETNTPDLKGVDTRGMRSPLRAPTKYMFYTL